MIDAEKTLLDFAGQAELCAREARYIASGRGQSQDDIGAFLYAYEDLKAIGEYLKKPLTEMCKGASK